MKKILITESQLNKVLAEAYPDKLVRVLINKFNFNEEGTGYKGLPETEIKYYINRFQEIQNSPYVKEKDIFKYTWDELKDVVEKNSQKPEQADRHHKKMKDIKLDPIKNHIKKQWGDIIKNLTIPELDEPQEGSNFRDPYSLKDATHQIQALEAYIKDLKKLSSLRQEFSKPLQPDNTMKIGDQEFLTSR